MPNAFVTFLAMGALGIVAAMLWLYFRRPSARRPAPRRRKATRADQIPTAPSGSTDLERLAWIAGKMTGIPPRQVPLDAPLAEVLAKVTPTEFAAAVGSACRTVVIIDEAALRMNLKQFAQYLSTSAARNKNRRDGSAHPKSLATAWPAGSRRS